MVSNTAQALVSESFINYKVQDINLDGNDELLVEASGGGNCCPPVIILYFYDNKEGILKEFIFEQWYAWNGWDEIDIKTKNNSAILTGVDAVHRGPDLKNISTSFLFDGDIIVLNSIELKSELPSLIEIRSEVYDINASSENLTMEYDINNDGFKDKIICDFWDRWSELTNCKVKLVNFGEIFIDYGGKRLGVLKTKKNGMHMLVFDHDVIFYFSIHIISIYRNCHSQDD